ncbi:BtrH N-terminal domain-containing protein [Actinoplanes sp. NPDC049118]|uniref:BtrH N-terminal domain-containing protein n=1 Tax=Actinoplanes sp. NPDC049118 TaxID=3155769 RepID=UPI0033D92B09
MTGQRRLKQLVRERMARTGESYTTARRHVVRPEPPALPGGLVPGYDTFGPGQHRLSSLAVHLLRQGGITCSEALVCGLAGGIGFMYAVFEYRGMPPMLTIVAQHHPEPWITSALSRLPISFVEEHSTSPSRALAALRAAVEQGKPVYVSVDRSRLPWHSGEAALATEPYGVVVAGIDGGAVLIDDSAAVPHRLSIDEFAAAWAGHKKGRHHRIVLETVSAGRPDIEGAIATTVAHLTGPVLGHSFDANFGFSGMRRFSDQLRDGRSKSGWQRRFGSAESFGMAMRRLYECLELSHTAPGGTRPLYADFLDEAAGLLDRPALSDAAKLFRESGVHWSALAARAEAHAGEYGELCERRMLLAMSGANVRETDERIAALPPVPDPGVDGRAALFAEMADLVDTAHDLEARAVEILAS